MRLIDADRAASIENLDQYSDLAAALGDVQTVRDILSDAPTIDAVPVVRCRECKRWDTDADSYGKDDGPKGTCMKFFEDTYSDDYCSYGQRKEADHDVSKNH